MAAATEDRINASFNIETAPSLFHDFGIVTDETVYARTLVDLDGSDNVQSLTHSASDDDSGVTVFFSKTHYEEGNTPLGNVEFDRGGTNGTVRVYSGAIVELDNDDNDQSGYSIGGTAYAVDDSTVSASSSDGSGGTYATAGTVYQLNPDKDTIEVLVPGILNL